MTFAQQAAAVLDNPDALRSAWETGQLWFLLREDQYAEYLWIRRHLAGGDMETPFWRYILEWCRRHGKTTTYLIIALEELRRRQGIRINFASATVKALKEIIWPIVWRLLATCPEDLRPVILQTAGHVEIHHGGEDAPHLTSLMVLAGCDKADQREKLRGQMAHLNFISEAGVIDDLKYLTVDILNPQLFTTRGPTLMEGTPPRFSGHEYADIINSAHALDARDGTPNARISRKTWRENKHDPPEVFQMYLRQDAELLGMTPEEYMLSSDFRREWECEVVTDENMAVIPECTPELMRTKVVMVEDNVPLFRDRFDSMDLGFNPDWTGILLGYWDYPRQVLCVEWEQVLRRAADTEIAECLGGRWKTGEDGQRRRVAFVGVESERFGEYGMEERAWGPHAPFLRVSDNNWPATVAELANVHGLPFTPTAKQEREVYIWHTRRWFAQGKIHIHPRCAMLIQQCQAAVWNAGRTDFARTSAHGHFDLLAALIIMVRNVIPYQNRVPPGWGATEDTWGVGRDRATLEPDAAVLRRAFG